jgi:hypothetical protein
MAHLDKISSKFCELAGTEKQIKYALGLRKQAYLFVVEQFRHSQVNLNSIDFLKLAKWYFERISQAKDWIENNSIAAQIWGSIAKYQI